MHLNRYEHMALSMIIAGLAMIGLFLLLDGTAQIARADPGPPLFASTRAWARRAPRTIPAP